MTPGAPTEPGAARLEQLAAFLVRARQAEELDERLELADASPAELQVAEALNAFLDKLWVTGFELAAKQEMLERVVEIRTSEVHEILDNVSTGFLLTRADERVLDNFSRSCATIFGRADLQGQRLSELMGLEGRGRDHFQMCYEQIFEDMLPPEVSIWQLPKEFTRGDHTYAIQGAPIFGKDGNIAKVFFTITDTTELRKLEAENALRKALIEIVRQRDGFQALLHDTATSFQAARAAASQAGMRNVLHTTKGNLGCYGLHEIAGVIHTIEDAPELAAAHLDHVEDLLKRFITAHHAIIGLDYPRPGSARDAQVERLRPTLEALVHEPSQAARQVAADELLHTLTWVPAHSLLSPLRALVDRVALRLDKPATLEVSGDDVLVDPRQIGPTFANLGHLVRNPPDPGPQPPALRGTKRRTGQIAIHCVDTPAAWHLEVTDDGSGIDVDAVTTAAIGKGRITAAEVAALAPEARLRLIFLDGVTTREEATMESGRGVGMSALLESVTACGGTLDVTTTRGVGTRFAIAVPKR